jgi:hydrogenase maturation protein HypF
MLQVQHHEAHLLSCVAEHGIRGAILGVAWDGAGLGRDGGIWGGEFLEKTENQFLRVGHFRPFRLPGGTVAMREPRRAALGLLFEIFGESCLQEALALGFTQTEARLLIKILKQGVNAPQTSSVGRLFDAVAALVGICSVAEYEGQAAAELEFAVDHALDKQGEDKGVEDKTNAMEAYPVQIGEGVPAVLDWEPWVRGVLQDRNQGLSVGEISAKFHRTLAHSIVLMAEWSGISQVVLSGGCFQNRILCETTISMLKEQGFEIYWNQKVPPNDGGISVGQVMGGWNALVPLEQFYL